MKNCTGCKYARWDRTEKGRLHPSGYGNCEYRIKIPKLPASWYWIDGNPPVLAGGFITRNEDMRDDCVYWTREDA